MPAEYQSTARALSLPVSPPRSPSHTRRSILPTWGSSPDASPSSGSSPGQSGPVTARQRWMRRAVQIRHHVQKAFLKLTVLQRLLVVVALLLALVFSVLFLVFSERVFAWLEPFADRWRELRAGWLIVWFLTFLTAFPPLIGYSSCLTGAGFLYGFPNGWYIVASASIVGSLCSFMLSRTILSSYVHRLVENDRRFEALALTLKHDGLKTLILIRLCPLPYSLSNGGMSTFPTVHPLMFTLATAIVTPRLMIHVFIGGRLAALAKSGGQMDAGTKAINYASIAIGIIIGVVVAGSIYQRTVARARQLEAEEREGRRRSSVLDETLEGRYNDIEGHRGFRNGLGQDDISLFEAEPESDGNYRDTFLDEDVFRHGDGDDEQTTGITTVQDKGAGQ